MHNARHYLWNTFEGLSNYRCVNYSLRIKISIFDFVKVTARDPESRIEHLSVIDAHNPTRISAFDSV